jgi:CheY-like chemotaxis protein
VSAASIRGTVTSEPSHDSFPRVVIVDDHAPFRLTARMLLTARGYDVVAEASCAATAREAVERHAPDGVLLDIHLGDDNGFAICAALTRSRPELAVLLASIDDPENLDLVTRCGARGFVRKAQLARIDFQEFWRARPKGAAQEERETRGAPSDELEGDVRPAAATQSKHSCGFTKSPA